MNYTFELAGILFELEFRKIKTMRLTVYQPNSKRADGLVKITAPEGTSRELIISFASSKLDWVKQQRKKFQENSTRLKTGTSGALLNGSTVYVWGEVYQLQLIEHSGNSRIKLDGGYVKMYIRSGSTKAKKQEVLDRWYRRLLKERAPEIIKKWEAHTGLSIKNLYFRKMKTCWGSCNYKKQTLRLNTELAKRKTECLEYVILHEMLHIIEKGHNKKFYRLLDKYMPEWKVIRKRMNTGEL